MISYLQVNQKGTLLATASERGTLIRVIKVETGEILHQFRRGLSYSHISSLNFSNWGPYLACGSSSGTLHIFLLKLNEKDYKMYDKKHFDQNVQLNNSFFAGNE
jgi:WD40 repeat protein